MLLITLRIELGYHINANPASSDFLIPTSRAFAGAVPEHVAYPPPSRLKAGFADNPLDVYDGDIRHRDKVSRRHAIEGAVQRVRPKIMTVAALIGRPAADLVKAPAPAPR